MRKNINLTWGYITSFLLFVIGVTLLCVGIYRQVGIQNAHDLNTLDSAYIREGDYVSGYIDEYLTGTSPTQGGLIALPKEYEIYAIRTVDARYIEFYISDVHALDALYAFEDGSGEGIYIEGRVISSISDDVNYGWYEHALGVADTAQLDQLIVTDLDIIETSFAHNKNGIILGLFLILGGIIVFRVCGGMAGFIRDLPTEGLSYSETTNMAQVMLNPSQIEVYLTHEQRELEYLLEKQHKNLRGGYTGAILLLVGGMLIAGAFLANNALSVEIFMLIAGIFQGIFLVGAVLCVIGIKKLWTAFINSQSPVADKIADIFSLDTTKKRIERTRRQIARLGAFREK